MTYSDREFAAIITKLIHKKDLSAEEAKKSFATVFNNQTTDMQQGAFLAALIGKGETPLEIAACWKAIYEHDTNTVDLGDIDVVENCGTGMDAFKTFNISTASALIAASAGVPMARHGARAITSSCGTVDMAEALGVTVECDVNTVAHSIREAGIGLFNGMSPLVHPQALGRILSQIHFGTTLNTGASLANPAQPKLGVRGVYSPAIMDTVITVMHEIGFKRALVIFGEIDGQDGGIDEASISGTTHVLELKTDGTTQKYKLQPEDVGLSTYDTELIAPKGDMEEEKTQFEEVLKGRGYAARREICAFNAGMILYVAGKTSSIQAGVQEALNILSSGAAFNRLKKWKRFQK